MSQQNTDGQPQRIKDAYDALVRFSILALLGVLCYQVFAPFSSLMVWALILAVGLYPLHKKIARRLKEKQGRSATLLVVLLLGLIGTPVVLLGMSFASHLQDAHTAFESKQIHLDPPDPKVAEWPIIGKKLYPAWTAASENLPQFLEANEEQLKKYAKSALSAAGSTFGQVLLFLAALIVAGIMMAFGESGSRAIGDIFTALSSQQKGPRLQVLATATIRSVAVGVIGVAFIQALLLGVGFVIAGVPAAGVLAVVVMLLGILQIPAAVVMLPAVAWIWMSGDASTGANIFYTVILLIGGLADNFLKPILLGRGVDAPMPVVLIGALGGMVVYGLVGLFVGAVILSLGYVIFMDWVADRAGGTATGDSGDGDAGAPTDPVAEQQS